MKHFKKIFITVLILLIGTAITVLSSKKPKDTYAVNCNPIYACEILCGTQCCNANVTCNNAHEVCCICGCKTSCSECCSCTTKTATTYTIPFTYTRGCCGTSVTVYTLPFSTNLGTYYTLPATYQYTGE